MNVEERKKLDSLECVTILWNLKETILYSEAVMETPSAKGKIDANVRDWLQKMPDIDE